ncbi:nuclear pore complex protein [Ceratobasidium sp. AG-Ba]|nr:nuclear pore complex protein [Ceratobasidium sp. AG-Ba]
MPHVNIAPVGVTTVPREASAQRDTPIGVFPSPATKDDLDDDHLRGRRRMFIGPMPENVAARLRATSDSGSDHVALPRNEFSQEDFTRDDIAADDASSTTSDSDCSSSNPASPTTERREVSRRRLLRAFLHRGGRREEFSEQEIRKRWHAGGWGRVPLPADASARRWVGSSFEVGADVVTGMDSAHHTLKDGREVEAVNSPHATHQTENTPVRSHTAPPAPSRTTTMETFRTARSSDRGESGAEESGDEGDGGTGDLKPLGVQAFPNRKSSKSMLTPSNPRKETLSTHIEGDPSSQATSTSRRPDTPVSSSPLLPARPPDSSASTRRPYSSLGVSNMFTDHNGDTKPQAVSAPHLVNLSNEPRPKEGRLRSALKRNLGSLRRSSSLQQRSVIFAESPKPLAGTNVQSYPGFPRSVSAPAPPTGPPTPMEHAPMLTESPAAPLDVLNRETEPEDTTSAGAALAFQTEEQTVPEDGVIRRDRMLVRAAFNRSPGLPKPYDEAEASKHPDTQEVEWKEMLVVWRKVPGKEDRIELYQDYTTPGKERILGHKDLAFIIPLDESVTNISPYSHVDLTFCLTCPPTPVRTGSTSKRARFHRAPIGTNIFVFKVKSRTRALDWTWNLWRYLGGELPETIDIHCPALGTRVRVDIPNLDRGTSSDSWKRFTRSYLIEACGSSLRGLPDWDAMMESPVLRGSKLELAWRKESKLDWVWLEHDEQGKELDWQVLFGLALRQPRLPSQLEIRLGLHAPTHVALTDGTVLGKCLLVCLDLKLTCYTDEPPAVEGYLHRIKPKTLVKTNVYITSHDGYLFTLRYANAEPPTPPSLIQEPLDAAGHKLARERELRRGRSMILDADGYIDLRSILAIRRAVEINPTVGPIDINTARANPLPHNVTEEEEESCEWVDQADASDNEDEGGEEFLSRSDDKMRLKMKRSFELVMRSGRVIRFEAYSRRTSLEWITRLRELVKYWTRRHRVDARDEMELVFATQGRARFTIPKLGKEEAPEGYFPDGASPYLAKFWNWCVIDGCRAIVKSGRLYTKKGIRKDFKHLFHVLIGGHLILFHITPNVTSYHHHSRTINLADAYVYSGQIAMRSLPRAAGVDSRQRIPRRYQDGLESDDRQVPFSEEDTTFIIWYRPHSIHKPTDPLLPPETASKYEPAVAPLGGKHNLLICKARSRLERDAWVWALNIEIERVSRMMSGRENNMRNQGSLVLD